MAIDFARGVATQILGSELRKVAGGIGGAIRPSSERPESPTEPLTRTKYSTDRLSFPLDIGDNPGIGEHGHYMLFFINEVQSAELGFGSGKDGAKSSEEAKAQFGSYQDAAGTPQVKEIETKRQTTKTGLGTSTNLSAIGAAALAEATTITGEGTTQVDTLGASSYGEYAKKKSERREQQLAAEEEKQIKERLKSDPEQKNTLFVKRAPTVRSKTVIQLYMPPNIQVAYKSDYAEAGITSLGKGAVDVFDTLTSAQDFTGKAKGVVDAVTNATGDMTLSAILKTADVFADGASAAYQIGKGQILADRMELMFKGISHREFQYTFKMMPRNSAEAREIFNICHAFKLNMLPEFGSDGRSGRRMNVPNTFNIHYMYFDRQNQYLDPISECVLTDFSVSYGGDGRFKTFDADDSGSPPPVETSIQMTFKELELITRERVEEGRALGGQIGFGPLNPVNS